MRISLSQFTRYQQIMSYAAVVPRFIVPKASMKSAVSVSNDHGNIETKNIFKHVLYLLCVFANSGRIKKMKAQLSAPYKTVVFIPFRTICWPAAWLADMTRRWLQPSRSASRFAWDFVCQQPSVERLRPNQGADQFWRPTRGRCAWRAMIEAKFLTE